MSYIKNTANKIVAICDFGLNDKTDVEFSCRCTYEFVHGCPHVNLINSQNGVIVKNVQHLTVEEINKLPIARLVNEDTGTIDDLIQFIVIKTLPIIATQPRTIKTEHGEAYSNECKALEKVFCGWVGGSQNNLYKNVYADQNSRYYFEYFWGENTNDKGCEYSSNVDIKKYKNAEDFIDDNVGCNQPPIRIITNQ